MAATDDDPPILEYAAPGIGGPSTLRPDLEQILQAGPTARQFSAYFEEAGIAKQYLIESLMRRFSAAHVTGTCATCGVATPNVADVNWTFSIPPVNQHGLVMPAQTEGEVVTCHSMCEACLKKSIGWTRSARMIDLAQSPLTLIVTVFVVLLALSFKFEWARVESLFLILTPILLLQIALPYVQRYCLRKSVPDVAVRAVPPWLRCSEVSAHAARAIQLSR